MTKRKTKKKAKPRAVMAWALFERGGKMTRFGYEHPMHYVLSRRAEALRLIRHCYGAVVVRRVRIEVLE